MKFEIPFLKRIDFLHTGASGPTIRIELKVFKWTYILFIYDWNSFLLYATEEGIGKEWWGQLNLQIRPTNPSMFAEALFHGDIHGGTVIACSKCYDERKAEGKEDFECTKGSLVLLQHDEYYDSTNHTWGGRIVKCPRCNTVLVYPKGAEW